MKILIRTGTTDDGAYVLCAGGADSPEMPFAVATDDDIQIVKRLRADFAEVINRGNGVTVISFPMTRTHESNLAAEEFLVRHKLEIPKQGTVVLQAETSTEADNGKTYLVDGTLHSAHGEQRGRSTVWQYTITGGELTTVDPDAEE
jgi:hypothetical protein